MFRDVELRSDQSHTVLLQTHFQKVAVVSDCSAHWKAQRHCLLVLFVFLVSHNIMEIEQHRKTPNILITGTPGCGKTTLAKLLNDSLQFQYLNISEIITTHKLYDSWNEEFNVPEFDDDKLLDFIEEHYKIDQGGLLFEFHSSEFFPVRYFDLVVLLRCDNTQLHDRLQARGYAPNKIL